MKAPQTETQAKATAIIPARGGSKGLPRKNILPLAGKPLILHTIDAAVESGVFSKIVVTSEDSEILEVCSSRAVVLLERPLELATDEASSLDVIEHALITCDAREGLGCLLQPTSPLRRSEHIRSAYQTLTSSRSSSLVSVVSTKEPGQKVLIYERESGAVKPILGWRYMTAPRQELDPTFHPNGAIYFFRIEQFLESKFLFEEPLSLYEMSINDSIDIDSKDDFDRAERLLK